MTYTYVIMEISREAYDEIAIKMREAKYDHVFNDGGEGKTALIDMHGIAVQGDGKPPREQPLLQCIDCRNTESPAGAMARHFNQGRCLHCGGYFKVVRA